MQGAPLESCAAGHLSISPSHLPAWIHAQGQPGWLGTVALMEGNAEERALQSIRAGSALWQAQRIWLSLSCCFNLPAAITSLLLCVSRCFAPALGWAGSVSQAPCAGWGCRAQSRAAGLGHCSSPACGTWDVLLVLGSPALLGTGALCTAEPTLKGSQTLLASSETGTPSLVK